jgi:hypothetical protein
MAKLDMVSFRSVEGSTLSDDGQTFILHVKASEGGDLLLCFPHSEVARIAGHAALQAAYCRDASGRNAVKAFKMTSFEVGRAPNGEAMLTLVVGTTGKIRFLVSEDLLDLLRQALHRRATDAQDAMPRLRLDTYPSATESATPPGQQMERGSAASMA